MGTCPFPPFCPAKRRSSPTIRHYPARHAYFVIKPVSYFKRSPLPYPLIMISAGVLSMLVLLQAYMHHQVMVGISEVSEFNWWREAPPRFLNYFCWALLAPMVYGFYQRWPLNQRPVWRMVLNHVVAGMLLGLAHEIVTSAVYYPVLYMVGELEFSPQFFAYAERSLAPSTLMRFIEYCTLLAVLIAVDYARQARERQTQLLKVQNELQVTQLNVLKKQLQPHFLFNTLNTVSALMDTDVNGARKVLSRLGRLLRASLEKDQRDIVPLSREMELIGDYLGIESVRFHDRLRVTVTVPEELHTALVPSMVLQPLVENAIKHGPDATSDRVEIHVRGERRGGTLALSVSDNGKGCDDVSNAMENGGIGLRNVRDRLRLLYGRDAHFAIASPGGLGFRVELAFPLKLEPARATAEQQAPQHADS